MRTAPNTMLPLFPHLLGTASFRVTQVFFHYAEVEGSERGRHPSIRPGDEFEFELGCDERSGKQCAIHLRSLPRGTVRFEERLLEGQRGTVVSLKCALHRAWVYVRRVKACNASVSMGTNVFMYSRAGKGTHVLMYSCAGKIC